MPEDDFEWIIPGGNGILGHLDSAGTVSFYVQAKEVSPVRGTEFFNAMMDAFAGRSRAIHGVWRKGPKGTASANIDKVNDLTAAGADINNAIKHAWTATRAAKRGYSRVRLLGEPVGLPGAYIKIDVLIEP